jgi:hypothetical protein
LPLRQSQEGVEQEQLIDLQPSQKADRRSAVALKRDGGAASPDPRPLVQAVSTGQLDKLITLWADGDGRVRGIVVTPFATLRRKRQKYDYKFISS